MEGVKVRLSLLWHALVDDRPELVDEDGRTLPWKFLRRQVRPFSLAVSVATYVIFAAMVFEAGVGEYLDQLPGKIIGVFAAVSSLLLWVGWWGRNKRWMDQGLLIAAAVWSAVSTMILVEGSSWVSGLIAFSWTMGSAGAWLLEVRDKRSL